MLTEQDPANRELTHVLRWCSDQEIRNAAWKMLTDSVGLVGVDETSLIKEIAVNVLERPGSLDMNSWHCGTSHCLAGWACVVNKQVMKVEKEHGTEIAGAAALPNYAHLFYSDNDTVLKKLEEVVSN